VGNWAVATAAGKMVSPSTSNTVAASLAPFPSLWINEVEPENLTGITNRAGQRVPWIEIYNPTTNPVSLAGLYLADNYTNLSQSPLPANAAVLPGQFMVVFADGETNLLTTNELHASFVLPAISGSVALSRYTSGNWQVLDYVNYANLLPDYSYGSYPDGQSFVRQIFLHPTPGSANDGSSIPPPSYVPYLAAGSVYTQNFDSLPDPGAASVNTANPVTIGNITYSLANPVDFAFPASASGNGGLGLPGLAGWYGLAGIEERFGATDGDQTTGGQISFGAANSYNRALGLLATSSTGPTSFAVRLINGTSQTLNFINLQFTGEIWRQSNLAKTLQFYYWIDPTATATLSIGASATLPALNVSFPVVSGDVGGVAVDGTDPVNQLNLSVTNQSISSWPAGTALWLVWQMADDTGKSQGLGIDNLSFSATALPSGFTAPALVAQSSAGANLVLSCPTMLGLSFQLEFKDDLRATNWTPVSALVPGTGNAAEFIIGTTNSQRFFRVKIVP